MPVVEIAQQWVDELAELQQDSAVVDMNDVVNAALRQYMFRQRQEKIARERHWYEAHYHEFVHQYRGQYVAVHNTRIIDSDSDGRLLSRRVRHIDGRVAVAIIHVADSPELPILQMRSPKLATL